MSDAEVHEEGLRVKLRPGKREDAEACGRICYLAFKTVAEQHGFPPDFPSEEAAKGVVSYLLSNPKFYSVIAETNDRIVGSNFLDERSIIAGIGPITVDPSVQNKAIGRQLMLDTMRRARLKAFPGVRLVQAAYHNRSLSLYTKLGFDPREQLSTMQGKAIRQEIPGKLVRVAEEGDLKDCNRICMGVHGHDRSGEVEEASRPSLFFMAFPVCVRTIRPTHEEFDLVLGRQWHKYSFYKESPTMRS